MKNVLTVGHLRQLLSDFDDETPVSIESYDSEWRLASIYTGYSKGSDEITDIELSIVPER